MIERCVCHSNCVLRNGKLISCGCALDCRPRRYTRRYTQMSTMSTTDSLLKPPRKSKDHNNMQRQLQPTDLDEKLTALRRRNAGFVVFNQAFFNTEYLIQFNL